MVMVTSAPKMNGGSVPPAPPAGAPPLPPLACPPVGAPPLLESPPLEAPLFEPPSIAFGTPAALWPPAGAPLAFPPFAEAPAAAEAPALPPAPVELLHATEPQTRAAINSRLSCGARRALPGAEVTAKA